MRKVLRRGEERLCIKNTTCKHERVIVNTKRKQVIMRGKLLQFKVIQINLLSSGGSWIID